MSVVIKKATPPVNGPFVVAGCKFELVREHEDRLDRRLAAHWRYRIGGENDYIRIFLLSDGTYIADNTMTQEEGESCQTMRALRRLLGKWLRGAWSRAAFEARRGGSATAPPCE